jgi:hypothetical protein
VPEESEREIHSPKLAWSAAWHLRPWHCRGRGDLSLQPVRRQLAAGQEGREFIEQPKWVKAGIVVAALIFLYNISMTVLAGKKTAITNILLAGPLGLSLLFLFAFVQPRQPGARTSMYWWYIVHLWVEGVWELVMASILAFLMLKLTGVDREVVEKWLYVIVATGAVLGHPWHRPPLLLDRHAGLLAVDRLDLLQLRNRALLRDDVLRLRDGLEGPPRPPEQGRAAVVLGCACWPSSAPGSGASCTRCTG